MHVVYDASMVLNINMRRWMFYHSVHKTQGERVQNTASHIHHTTLAWEMMSGTFRLAVCYRHRQLSHNLTVLSHVSESLVTVFHRLHLQHSCPSFILREHKTRVYLTLLKDSNLHRSERFGVWMEAGRRWQRKWGEGKMNLEHISLTYRRSLLNAVIRFAITVPHPAR